MASLDKEKQLEYNLAVLKRRDAAISGVVDMSGHVVLYRFSEETQAWDRRNVEGSLFVVSRSEEPKYQFVVLNRISSENLIESVTSDFQMELTDQFLLYRNLNSEILGVWFYSPPERAAISEALNLVDDQRSTQREWALELLDRLSGEEASTRAHVVGFTGAPGAGKSSLLNRLTDAEVMVQNALFATLDPTVRQSRTAEGITFTYTDTVGFVRNLPHQLVEANGKLLTVGLASFGGVLLAVEGTGTIAGSAAADSSAEPSYTAP